MEVFIVNEQKALQFAINAHKSQVRKSEPDKPMIIHPIDVGNILREYNFDSNVISAGYLHDVVEDTRYTIEDIKNMFGDDVASLVMGASEPDKSLSWEERKKHTIETIKTLDLRHRAIICADKISNLEDLRNYFGRIGTEDFSHFKRGFEEQKWYYQSVYENLSSDIEHPMFERLKELLDYLFNSEKHDDYLKNTIFQDNLVHYENLLQLHYKKQELKKLKGIVEMHPYVIEFTGTPRTGKTTLIHNLNDFFKKAGFSVAYLEEFTTSSKYKKEIYPKLKDQYKSIINTEIPKYVLQQLKDEIDNRPNIIIVDRSLFDRMIWMDRLYLKDGVGKEEYDAYNSQYVPLIKDNIDIIIATYTDSLTSLQRDYMANLSLEERHFLNEQNVNEYNASLVNMEKLAKEEDINLYRFDTTDCSIRELSIQITNTILDDMRKSYVKQLHLQFSQR